MSESNVKDLFSNLSDKDKVAMRELLENDATAVKTMETEAAESIQSQVPDTQVQPAARTGPSWLVQVVVNVLLCLIITGSVLYYYDKNYALHVQTCDLRAFLTTLKNEVGDRKITQEQVTKSIKDLQHKIQIQSGNGNTIVLLKEVVLGGDDNEIKP